MKLLQNLQNFAQSPWYWLAYISTGVFLLATALFYQYVFDELPCVMCIHVRLWLVLFVIISLLGLFTRLHKRSNLFPQSLSLLVAVALTERSYQLLGTERGFISGSCGFKTGLPDWFAINEWMPWLFGVETTCGYTPEIIFGITMAEVLMVLSVLLVILIFSVLLMYFKALIQRDL